VLSLHLLLLPLLQPAVAAAAAAATPHLAKAADAVKGPQLPNLGHYERLTLQDVVVREHQLLAVLQAARQAAQQCSQPTVM
jgi:hypothetical protein